LLSARSALPELRCLHAVDVVCDQIARSVDQSRRAEAAVAVVMRRARLLLRLLAMTGQTAVLLLALPGVASALRSSSGARGVGPSRTRGSSSPTATVRRSNYRAQWPGVALGHRSASDPSRASIG
jgi:hypothetical protein